MSGIDWQAIATVSAAVLGALIAGSVASLNRRDDTLGKAERLSKLVDSIVEPTSRALAQDLRDAYVVQWTLKQMAPRMPLLNAIAMAFYVIGAIGFAGLCFILIPLKIEDLGDLLGNGEVWTLYWMSAISLVVAQFLRSWVIENRRAWIVQEAMWRGISLPTADSQKRVKVDFGRVIAFASPFPSLFLRYDALLDRIFRKSER